MIHPQPRSYLVRLHNRDGQVHTGQQHMIVLDLTPGPTLDDAERKLSAQLRSLVRAVTDPGDDVGDYYLAVYDWDTGEFRFHWSAR